VKISFRVLVAALWLAVTVVGESRAQEPSPTPNPVGRGAVVARPAVQPDFSAVVALKVSIVLAKYQNEKRISNLPYELTVRTDGKNASIRMGARVPLPEANFVPAPPAPPAKPGEPPAKAPPPLQSFSFRDVGTNIDCTATNLDAGRYAVTVTVEDTSVFTAADSRTRQVNAVLASQRCARFEPLMHLSFATGSRRIYRRHGQDHRRGNEG
jgi:hypothetical protein